LKEEDAREIYSYDKDNVAGITNEEDFNRMV
jgi:hypothetical protein